MLTKIAKMVCGGNGEAWDSVSSFETVIEFYV